MEEEVKQVLEVDKEQEEKERKEECRLDKCLFSLKYMQYWLLGQFGEERINHQHHIHNGDLVQVGLQPLLQCQLLVHLLPWPLHPHAGHLHQGEDHHDGGC